ncbi:T9SS type B sorting domain-containing protein [Flavobacteriaceae bacterium]|nr:T9SS type B sorting domain-containing protein [Flavobacteriaceae bacterium]
MGTCVTINGARSVWYKIKIESGTELTFDIIPTVRSTDYDFVVYGPNPDCENVTDDIALRANYSGVTGPTGLSSSTINDCQDGGETPYSSAINVQAGEEYLVVVDRFSGTASTFDLIWGGDAVLDCSIVVGDLGEDQEVCEGTIVTLDGTTSSPTASNYQWFLDTGSGFSELTGETNSILIINNDVSGIYKVQVTDLDGSTDDDEVEINFYTVPVIVTPPSDINRCDEDRDGFLDFDLITDQTPEILNGLDPSLDSTDFEVLYFDNPSDANLNTTTAIIVNPYRVNTSENPTIYARIHNVDNTSCYTTVQFKLKVTDIPTPSQPTEYRVCDDTTSAGGNTDGVSGFLLNTKDAEILTGITNPGDYNISYHTDPLDAQTSSTANAIPKDIDYEVTGSQTVFVRVENIANTDCYAISDDTTGSTFTSFELIVDATPVIVTPPSDINRCDEDRVGFLNFDLIIDQTPEILNGLDLSLDSTDFEVLYFDNPSDADLNTTVAIIVNPYRVNTSDNPTIYARIHNVDNISCYTIVQFKLKVTDTPTPTQPTVYRLCDDTASGSDTDGMSSFLLNTKDAEILTGVTNPGEYTISYHTDILDAQTSSTTNAIPKDTDYQVTTSKRVYVRIENIANADCNAISDDSASSTFKSFELIVDPLPVISSPVELKQCDDDTDGFSFFNLNEAASDISTNYLNETFVFYPRLLDADNGTNAYTPAEALAFRNRTVTTDTVWARAISGFGCYRIAEVNLVVSTTGLPTTFQRSFTLCDDFLDIDGIDTINNDDTDGVTAFNFSSVTAEVRALFPASQQLTITYYRNQANALAEVDAITDTANYRNIGYPNTQQIYIRVDSDLDNDCLGFGPFITLTVDPVPTADPVTNLILCDNGDDGDFINGIVQTFNLESQTPIIRGTQDPLNFTVTYHTSDTDALSGANQIINTTMYENIIPNLETIYVRVANNTTGCFTNHTSFDLIVNELPIANFVDDLEVCDDNTDGSAQNGFSQSFDLNLQTDGILGTQDPTQFSVTYHASLTNAQAGILPLGSPFSNSVPFSQIIYARVYNSLTGCANGISNFNAIVNPEPTTENVSNLSFCDDDLDGDDTNGFVQNIDLDSQITEILGPLQDPDDFTVTFHETQADASAGTDALSSPYTNTTADQQTIFVRVLNDDTLCVNDDFTFEVIINPLPKFKVTSPQIVCLSGPPLTLFVENPAAVYDYVWTAPNGDESFGSQITIESGGLYTVTATTTNGTLCARTREIQVNESIVATITDADVTIVDDSENNSITIDPTNLGIGDYQYALINEDGNQTSFQDIPLFENLAGGFYTIVVEDKNGCRPNATLEVSVIEYPKFFTPNNDGVNDTWAIKGANSTFYPNAKINIFNRFGKAVAQIEVDTPGWTGTYGGKTLPSDDYWFSIILVDRNGRTRNRKGNFSLLRR